mgnify:CR=1 FL=1
MDDRPIPLSKNFLQSALSTHYIGRPILYYPSIPSTNTLGFQVADTEMSHGTVILADHQTAGKGRLGRTWHSPKDTNLYFSIILTQLPCQSLISWIPLLTGVVLAECLEAVSTLSISLKWPNDVLCHDKKLGGILCEVRQKGVGKGVCVIGIGININCNKDDFPSELSPTATSLAIESHRTYHCHNLLTLFLENFESQYEHLLTSGTYDLRSQYILRCQTLKQAVLVHSMTGTQVKGQAVNIGEDGALQIVTSENSKSGTMTSIRSGDVFHVR